jgi:hypothetical protein
MIDSAILDAMLAAGASAEVIVAAVKADAARDDARRAAQRAGNARRQRRYRDRLHGDETGDLFDGVDGGPGCDAQMLPGSPEGSTVRGRKSDFPTSSPRTCSGVHRAAHAPSAEPAGRWMPEQVRHDGGSMGIEPEPSPHNACHASPGTTNAAPGVTGAIPPSLDKSPRTPKINPNPRAHGGRPACEAPAPRFPCPAGCDPNDWRDLLANRRAKRLAMTDAAYRKLIRDLAAQADDAWPPGRLLAHAAEKGWAQIFDPRDDQQGARHGNRPATARVNPGEPQNPLVRAVLRSEARGAGGGGAGF